MRSVRMENGAGGNTPAALRGGQSFLLINLGLLAGLVIAFSVDSLIGRSAEPGAMAQSTPIARTPNQPTVAQLLLMPDSELDRYCAADLNAIVAQGIGTPIDLAGTEETLAEWSRRLRPTDALNPTAAIQSQGEQLWVNVVAGLQQRMGVKIVAAPSSDRDPKDLILGMALKEKRLTSHTLPILLEYLGRQWGRPLDLVGDNDRLVCRLQRRGEPPMNLVFDEKGASAPSNEQLIRLHGIPAQAVKNGSDLSSLSNRQLLAWFLGQRSAVFLNTGDVAKAEADLLLARSVFPESRSLFLRMTQLMERRGPQVLGSAAWAMLRGDTDPVGAAGIPRIPRTAEEVMQFNQRGSSLHSMGFSDPIPANPAGIVDPR